MANLLDRFKVSVIGSDNTIRDYLPTIEAKGDFQSTTDLNVIINSWKNILLTPRRNYPHDPEYGSDLYKMIFDPLDEITVQRIEDEVYITIQRYDNRAFIESIDIKYLKVDKGVSLDIYVDYKGEKGILSLILNEQLFSGLLSTEG
jgi:phage baseplate assembly protein W